MRIRYTRHSEIVVDVYREQATLLTADIHEGARFVALEYEAEGCVGRLLAQVTPTFTMKDTFLRV